MDKVATSGRVLFARAACFAAVATLVVGCGTIGGNNSNHDSPKTSAHGSSGTAIACTPLAATSTSFTPSLGVASIVNPKYVGGVRFLPGFTTDSTFVLPLKATQTAFIVFTLRAGATIRAPFAGMAQLNGSELSLEHTVGLNWPPPVGSPSFNMGFVTVGADVSQTAVQSGSTGVALLESSNHSVPSASAADIAVPSGARSALASGATVAAGQMIATVVHPVQAWLSGGEIYPGATSFQDSSAVLAKYYPFVNTQPRMTTGDILLSSPDLDGTAKIYSRGTDLGTCTLSLSGYATIKSSTVGRARVLVLRGTEPWGTWEESCTVQHGACDLSLGKAATLGVVDEVAKTINAANAQSAYDSTTANFTSAMRYYVPQSPAYQQLQSMAKSAKPAQMSYQGISFMPLAELVGLSDGQPGVVVADTEHYVVGGKDQRASRTYFMQYDSSTHRWLIQDAHQSWYSVSAGYPNITLTPASPVH